MGWNNAWGAFAPWMVLGPVMMLVFIAVCMALVLFFVRGVAHPAHKGERAINILRERYARGEIDQAEFEERRRVILG
jgi:putative membrane protein